MQTAMLNNAMMLLLSHVVVSRSPVQVPFEPVLAFWHYLSKGCSPGPNAGGDHLPWGPSKV